MRASDLLVASLEREGVEHVFGLPGEEMEDLLFSIRDSEVTFVPVRHEQGAAFMADVHGRLTGDAGVCLSTLGPGATNLLTGVADAHLDKSPLVAITAQGSLERLHKESHQALDVIDLFGPITKWNAQLNDPDIIHESVRKAFKMAEHEKPGATHLELPEDVAAEDADVEPMPTRDRVRVGAPDREALDRVKSLLEDADRPIAIAGNGAVRTRASSQLRALVEATDMPTVSTYMGKGAVSDDDEHSLLTLDSGAHGEAASALEEADLVLTVGYDIAEHDPAGWEHGSPVVHVDSQPAEVYEAYNPQVEVIADIGETLRELTEWCEAKAPEFDTEWYADRRDHIVDDIDREPTAEAPFTVESVVPMLRDAMADDDVLISDVGNHKMAIAQNFPTYEPNTCIISNGLASMGIGVPGGLAADLAVDSNVVVGTGDGGFLMNAAEIETATRLGCSYTIVVFCDDDYGLISRKQSDHTGESFGTTLTTPDLVTFAESFGIDGYRADSAEELESALDEAVGGDMALIEVPVEGTS
ncbi:acetolactate synthase large subunit [Haloarcula nitratireducens]|uniref:Acetolactate synthase large subunit n=1 Tax=Haloarcula nitratireducens TaxID=2487749 RepID=A0AAW4P901_9EURY|nr:acetolactate synthase large subunit [Halomicroarcula nitratireducens]MBX0294243.1 acetolactate synthase large subunit [Halomicroarcula nitratireducens]